MSESAYIRELENTCDELREENKRLREEIARMKAVSNVDVVSDVGAVSNVGEVNTASSQDETDRQKMFERWMRKYGRDL